MAKTQHKDLQPNASNEPQTKNERAEDVVSEKKKERAEGENQYTGWSYGYHEDTHTFFINYGKIHDTIVILSQHIEQARNDNKKTLANDLTEKKQALETHLKRLKDALYLEEKNNISLTDGMIFEDEENSFDKFSNRFDPNVLKLPYSLEGNVKDLHDKAYPLEDPNEVFSDYKMDGFSEDQINAQKQLPQYDYGNFSVELDIWAINEELIPALAIIKELKDKNNAQKYGDSLRKDILAYEQYRQLVMELISTEYRYIQQCHQAIDSEVFLKVAQKYVQAVTKDKGATSDAAKDAAAILKQSATYLIAIDAYQRIQHVLPVSLTEMDHFSQDINYGLIFMERAYSQTLLNNVDGPLVPIIKRYETLSAWIAEVMEMNNANDSSLNLEDNEKAMLSTMAQFLLAPIQRQPRYQTLALELGKSVKKIIQVDENEEAQLILDNMQKVAELAPTEINNIEDQNKKLAKIREDLGDRNISGSLLQSVLDHNAIRQSHEKDVVPMVNQSMVKDLVSERPKLINIDNRTSFVEPRIEQGNRVIEDDNAKDAKSAHISYYTQINNILDLIEKQETAYRNRNALSRWWNKKSHSREQQALHHLLDIAKLSHETFRASYKESEDLNEVFDAHVKNLKGAMDNAKKAYENLQKQWLFNPFKRYNRSQLKKVFNVATEKYTLSQAAYTKLQEENSPLNTPVAENSAMKTLYEDKINAIQGKDYTTLRASNFYEDCVATSKSLWFFQVDKKKAHANEILLHKMRSKSKIFREAVDSLMAGENNPANVRLWSEMVVPVQQV